MAKCALAFLVCGKMLRCISERKNKTISFCTKLIAYGLCVQFVCVFFCHSLYPNGFVEKENLKISLY